MSTADTEQITRRRFERMRPARTSGSRATVDRGALPPGPRGSALLQTLALTRYRHRAVPALRRRYGDTFTLRLLPEGQRLVFFHRPEHVREIFAGDPEVFHAGKGNAILGPVMGEHSLLLVDSAQHKRARRMLMPAFNARSLRGYEDLVTGLAKSEVGSWNAGGEITSLDRMNALTLEIILRVVFGVTDESRLAALRPLVQRTVDISPLVILGWGVPRLQSLGIWKRTVDNQVELDRLLFAEIRERRTAGDLEERTDVLSQLLRVRDEDGSTLTDEELRDQLVTLLLAGHETTATALAWSLHELGKDPAAQRRAREAAIEGDTDHLENVLKEAMRLHPVIPMVVRHLMAPATVGGLDLPAGVTVAASILLAHADPEQHRDPEAFRPERFAEGEVAVNTWIPFGGGVRRCIGAGFSLMEGVAVLREVLMTHEVQVSETERRRERPRVRNITSVPHRGARLAVRRLGG